MKYGDRTALDFYIAYSIKHYNRLDIPNEYQIKCEIAKACYNSCLISKGIPYYNTNKNLELRLSSTIITYCTKKNREVKKCNF